MHMVDALVTPVVGGTMWASAATAAGVAYKRMPLEETERKVAQMGVMGAFVFAAQMINFTIPGTGASGHIGGGMLLSILLGPAAAYLTMGMVLMIQALFFADGGILAFGANWMNMGFATCFIAYPLIYQPLMAYFRIKGTLGKIKEQIVTVIATVVGLQIGAFSVVVLTYLSHTTALSFTTFLAFMQPIHLAIGLVEGVITAVVVAFVREHEPGLIHESKSVGSIFKSSRKVMGITLLTAIVIAYFASANPDGLEWAMEKIQFESAAQLEIESPVAIMPDYNLPENMLDKLPIDMTGLAGLLGVGVMLLIAFAVNKMMTRSHMKESKVRSH